MTSAPSAGSAAPGRPSGRRAGWSPPRRAGRRARRTAVGHLGARPSEGSSSRRTRGSPSGRARSPASAARLRTAGRRADAAAPAGAGSARAARRSPRAVPSRGARSAEHEVVEHREFGKHLPAFRHQRQARAHTMGRLRSMLAAVEMRSRPLPGGAGPRSRASASTCRRRSRRAPPPPRRPSARSTFFSTGSRRSRSEAPDREQPRPAFAAFSRAPPCPSPRYALSTAGSRCTSAGVPSAMRVPASSTTT